MRNDILVMIALAPLWPVAAALAIVAVLLWVVLIAAVGPVRPEWAFPGAGRQGRAALPGSRS